MLLGVARRRIIMRHRSFFIGITLALIITAPLSSLAQAQGGHNRVNAEQLSAADLTRYSTARFPVLRSSAALVIDQRGGGGRGGRGGGGRRPGAAGAGRGAAGV